MSDVLELLIDRINTPIGEMIIVADRDGNLRAVDWTDHEPRLHNFLRLHYGKDGFKLTPTSNPNGLSHAISSYFAGDLTAIDNLPVKTNGTPFQRQVWRALREIPCGTTVAYGKLASQIGRPTAVRAIGLANGSNPVGVIVPCHRVIGSNGSLTGYGGGMERKRWLLEHEGASTPSIAQFAVVGEASGAHLTEKRAAPPLGEREELKMGTAGLSKPRLDRMHQVLSGFIERKEMPGLVALVSRHDDVHVETLGTLAFDDPAPRSMCLTMWRTAHGYLSHPSNRAEADSSRRSTTTLPSAACC